MIFLSGGTGTPKLLSGLKEIISEEKIKVIVNTAEDMWVSGNLVCPDIDSVLYTLSGLIDENKWWGIKNDTFTTHEALKSKNYYEPMMLGDMDRATHIARSELLREGKNLTEATAKIASEFGIKAKILPMSDDYVATMIQTSDEKMHFQKFWIEKKGEPDVLGVEFEGSKIPEPTESVLSALKSENTVFIGPSNPITSIGPILSLSGITDILKEKYVVAISPIIGKQAVSGPAGKLMAACGFEVSSYGVFEFYREFLDLMIVDEKDDCLIEGIDVLKTDTIMSDIEKSKDLAGFVMRLMK